MGCYGRSGGVINHANQHGVLLPTFDKTNEKEHKIVS